MGIIVGSARSDERGKLYGGVVGDQTGREVSTQPFYMHSKGWYVLRPKSVDVANKIAEAMKQGCNNDRIGYNQHNRFGVVTNVKKYKKLKDIIVKTECDCSSLVRACIYQATGKDVGNFTTVNEVSVLESSGLFNKKFKCLSVSDVCNGDVLVTKSKGHTVVVVSGRPRKVISETANKPSNEVPSYKVGRTYTTQVELRVRKGAGTKYGAKTHKLLTLNARKHDRNKNGCIDKGTRVTCKAVKKAGKDIWIKIPSGWVAAYYQGHIYIE